MGRSCSTDLPGFRCLMNPEIPPLYLNSRRLASPVLASVCRSSVSVICRPLFRKANSRRRWARVSKLYSETVKISLSGRKWIFVPRFLVVPVLRSLPCGSPLEYPSSHTLPSRHISRSHCWLSAFTQAPPPPRTPPEPFKFYLSHL